jgi:hypothetical protein
MFVSCTVFVLSGRGLCDGPIPRPEESYRLWCVSACDQVKINNLDTCCEHVGRRGKDYKTKRICRTDGNSPCTGYAPQFGLLHCFCFSYRCYTDCCPVRWRN